MSIFLFVSFVLSFLIGALILLSAKTPVAGIQGFVFEHIEPKK